MTAAVEVGTDVLVRNAEPGDNNALRAIAAACPMHGDISLCVTREPDFFVLNRLEGERWRTAVAEVDGEVVGCIMSAERAAYVNGVRARTLYAGDLKVHPAHRGTGVADALIRWTCEAGEELVSADAPVLLSILAGNRSMEQRADGRRGLPSFSRVATIRAFSIPLFWPRSADVIDGIRIGVALPGDVEEMSALWERVAPERQFAPMLDARALSSAMSAPGIIGYRIARSRDGRMLGFIGWWDQFAFKQTRVFRYSRQLNAARAVIDAAARFTRTPLLPQPGEPLRYRTAVHMCVPGASPVTLRALLLDACREMRAQSYPFITIGLDARDPVAPALKGLFAQPTDIGAYITAPSGRYPGALQPERPLHYEIAFV